MLCSILLRLGLFLLWPSLRTGPKQTTEVGVSRAWAWALLRSTAVIVAAAAAVAVACGIIYGRNCRTSWLCRGFCFCPAFCLPASFVFCASTHCTVTHVESHALHLTQIACGNHLISSILHFRPRQGETREERRKEERSRGRKCRQNKQQRPTWRIRNVRRRTLRWKIVVFLFHT